MSAKAKLPLDTGTPVAPETSTKTRARIPFTPIPPSSSAKRKLALGTTGTEPAKKKHCPFKPSKLPNSLRADDALRAEARWYQHMGFQRKGGERGGFVTNITHTREFVERCRQSLEQANAAAMSVMRDAEQIAATFAQEDLDMDADTMKALGLCVLVTPPKPGHPQVIAEGTASLMHAIFQTMNDTFRQIISHAHTPGSAHNIIESLGRRAYETPATEDSEAAKIALGQFLVMIGGRGSTDTTAGRKRIADGLQKRAVYLRSALDYDGAPNAASFELFESKTNSKGFTTYAFAEGSNAWRPQSGYSFTRAIKNAAADSYNNTLQPQEYIQANTKVTEAASRINPSSTTSGATARPVSLHDMVGEMETQLHSAPGLSQIPEVKKYQEGKARRDQIQASAGGEKLMVKWANLTAKERSGSTLTTEESNTLMEFRDRINYALQTENHPNARIRDLQLAFNHADNMAKNNPRSNWPDMFRFTALIKDKAEPILKTMLDYQAIIDDPKSTPSDKADAQRALANCEVQLAHEVTAGAVGDAEAEVEAAKALAATYKALLDNHKKNNSATAAQLQDLEEKIKLYTDYADALSARASNTSLSATFTAQASAAMNHNYDAAFSAGVAQEKRDLAKKIETQIIPQVVQNPHSSDGKISTAEKATRQGQQQAQQQAQDEHAAKAAARRGM